MSVGNLHNPVASGGTGGNCKDNGDDRSSPFSHRLLLPMT